jgi:cytochrome P450
MRQLHPVAYDEKNDVWGIFWYNDVRAILTDHTNFSSDPRNSSLNLRHPLPKDWGAGLLQSDLPYHQRLRAVVASAFTSVIISKLESKIKRITNEMINEVIQVGKMDLITDLAYPLPVRIIAELLGLPTEDHDRFKRWADDLVGLAGGGGHLEDPAADFSRMLDLRTVNEMIFYFSKIIRQRQAVPQDDLITSLVRAEEEGNRLTEQELIRFCILVLLAGRVTTVDLIGNMVLSLLESPREFKRLQADHSLIVTARRDTTLSITYTRCIPICY